MWIAQKHVSHFTVICPGKDRENKQVFNLDFKDDNVRDDVSSSGILFIVFAAALRKARSPMVWRVDGTASAEVDDERRRCRPGSSGCRSSGSPARVLGDTGTPARHACIRYSLRRMKPMQTVKQRCDVVVFTELERQSSCCIHDCLETV